MAAVDVKKDIRDIKQLNPIVRIMLEEALKRIKEKEINPLVTETYRTKERQYYLYGQGRTYSQCVGAGMPSQKAKAYANPSKTKVTWTLDSIHIKKCAVDLIPQRNGKAIYNSKDAETKKIIAIMEKVGFEAGANWQNSPDSPHFQVEGISGKVLKRTNTNKFLTKMIQRQLKKVGFYDYNVDGKWSTATNRAIKQWKKHMGWAVNTNIGTKALKELLRYR